MVLQPNLASGCAFLDSKFQESACYLESVSNDGCDLVCKSFGVLSPFALSTLLQLHTTLLSVKSTLPHKFTQRQLLQWLSVTL